MFEISCQTWFLKQEFSVGTIRPLRIKHNCFSKANLWITETNIKSVSLLKGDESSLFLLFTLYGTEKNMSFLLEVFGWVNAFYNVNCVADKNHFTSSLNHFSRVLFVGKEEGSVEKNKEIPSSVNGCTLKCHEYFLPRGQQSEGTSDFGLLFNIYCSVEFPTCFLCEFYLN